MSDFTAVVVRLGQTSVEATEWESATTMRCMVTRGARGTRRVVVTAAYFQFSVTELFSVDAGSLSVTLGLNAGGTGSASVTVHGGSLGLVSYSAMGRLGLTGCEGTEWESDTSLRCMTGSWTRGTRQVMMTMGIRSESITHVFSVDTHHLAQVELSGGYNRVGYLSAGSITVHGSGMGSYLHTVHARSSLTGCESTVWDSDSALSCMSGRWSSGTTGMVLTVGERTASMTQIFSLDRGKLSVLTRANTAATGSTSVTIHGVGFGVSSLTARIQIAQTMSEVTSWQSEFSILCMISAGARTTKRVAITAASM